MQVAVVALTEESLFRFVFPQLIKLCLPFGTEYDVDVISAFICGLLHFFDGESVALGCSAFLSGLNYSRITRDYGLISSFIAHTVHNLCIDKTHDLIGVIIHLLERSIKLLDRLIEKTSGKVVSNKPGLSQVG